MAFGSLGFGKSSSSSKSEVWPVQRPFLRFGYNQGQDIYNQFAPGAGQFAQTAGADLYGFGQSGLGQLTSNPFLSGLQQQAGGNPELVAQQLGALESGLTDFWTNTLQPGIGRDYQSAGAFGGSRQAVAETLGAGQIANAYTQGASNIYTQDAQRALQAATAGGGLLAQGILGGMSALPSMFDVGMGQFTGGFAPLDAYMNIIGSPTVLGSSKRSSFNINGGFEN